MVSTMPAEDHASLIIMVVAKDSNDGRYKSSQAARCKLKSSGWLQHTVTAILVGDGVFLMHLMCSMVPATTLAIYVCS
jgi:hypothetical protein